MSFISNVSPNAAGPVLPVQPAPTAASSPVPAGSVPAIAPPLLRQAVTALPSAPGFSAQTPPSPLPLLTGLLQKQPPSGFTAQLLGQSSPPAASPQPQAVRPEISPAPNPAALVPPPAFERVSATSISTVTLPAAALSTISAGPNRLKQNNETVAEKQTLLPASKNRAAGANTRINALYREASAGYATPASQDPVELVG